MSKLRMKKVTSTATGATYQALAIDGPTQLVDESLAAAHTGWSTSYLAGARTGRGRPGPPFVRIGRAIAYEVSALDKWATKNPPRQQGVVDATQAMTGRRRKSA